jgi:pimeloyl-ACP methyl ester carboxylesterase
MPPPFFNTITLGSAGPPLVLLHGWGQSAAGLLPLGKLLSRTHSVYLVDLPGFGQSPRPEEDWDTVAYAAHLRTHLLGMGLERVHLLGHSFGGRVSLRLASAHPEMVAGLILMDAAGLPARRSLKKRVRMQYVRLLGKLARLVDGLLKTSLTEAFRQRYGSSDYKAAGALRGILVKTVNEDQTEQARSITSPTLLVWGERDEQTPVEMAERFQALVRNTRLVVLPGRGHFPYLLSDGTPAPEQCAHHILQFLNQVPLEPTP